MELRKALEEDLDIIKKIYLEAFPEEERKPFEMINDLQKSLANAAAQFLGRQIEG